MTEHEAELGVATRLVGGARPVGPGASLNPAVEFTSTYRADGLVDYARSGNPTWTAFEQVLGDLEGGQALAFGSGMGAIAATLDLVPTGGVVVAPRHAYSGTGALLRRRAEQGAVELRVVDIADADAAIEALDGAALLWTESPTNPMLEIADLPTLFAAAAGAGALSVCDNTFSTPLLQRPLALGADVVVHSVTKYLSGHADVLMGATVTADPGLQERLLTARTLDGAIPGPMETWLALRGMRTLHLRMERSCANAAQLAQRAADHPAVQRVRYPGSGAVIALEVAGGRAGAERLERAVRVWTCATSLGGVESLLERRRRHAMEPDSVPEELVRLSVGVEDVEDLWRDLAQALDEVAGRA